MFNSSNVVAPPSPAAAADDVDDDVFVAISSLNYYCVRSVIYAEFLPRKDMANLHLFRFGR